MKAIEFMEELKVRVREESQKYGSIEAFCLEKKIRKAHISNLMNNKANFTIKVLCEIMTAINYELKFKKIR